MPIYEYQCGNCGHLLEAFQRISEDLLKTCPKCHQDELSRLISATTFQLKGSGWYATDYAGKGKPPEKKIEEKTDKKPENTSNETKKTGDEKKVVKETKSDDKKAG